MAGEAGQGGGNAAQSTSATWVKALIAVVLSGGAAVGVFYALTVKGTQTLTDAAGTGPGTITSVADKDINVAASGSGKLAVARTLTVPHTAAQGNELLTAANAADTSVLNPTHGGTGVANVGTLGVTTNANITGGGTLALGGYTLTAPATGTAALLNGTGPFTAPQTLTEQAAPAAAGTSLATIYADSTSHKTYISQNNGGYASVVKTLPAVTMAAHALNYIALTTNVATITTWTPHGLVTGHTVVISACAEPHFVVATGFLVTVTSPTTFTFALTHGNITNVEDATLAYTATAQTQLGADPTLEAAATDTLINASAATSVPLTIKGASGQTANLLNLTDSTGAVVAAVQKDGNFLPRNVGYTWPAAIGGPATVLTDAAGNGTLSWAAAGASLTGTTQTLTPFLTVLGSSGANSATGVNNTAVGYQSSNAMTTGTDNTTVGYRAGLLIAGAGNFNTIMGSGAGKAIVTGDDNTIFGYTAGAVNTANANTIIGSLAGLLNTSGVGQTIIGYDAGGHITTGNYLTAVGMQAGHEIITANNTAVGYQALNAASGADSTAIGYLAGTLNTAANNVFVGSGAGYRVTSGSNSVLIGVNAGGRYATGGYNVCLGSGAGDGGGSGGAGTYNICIGYGALPGNGGLNYQTILGASANAGGYAPVVLLGAGSTATATNQFVCGSANTTITDVYFGKGVSAAGGANYTIHGTANSTGAGAGGNITLQGGVPGAGGLPGRVVLASPLNVATGAAGSTGTATVNGITGVTVSTTAVTASSIIIINYNTPKAGVLGIISAPVASITADTSFVIFSTDAADTTSTVNWWILN